MPHTVEEAYELADAAHSGDDAKLRRRARRRPLPGLLPGAAARGARRGRASPRSPTTCRAEADPPPPARLRRRRRPTRPTTCVRNWDEIKRDDERGGAIFGDDPGDLPSTLYAKKVLKRAAERRLRDWIPMPRDDAGERLLAAVRDAVDAGVDPELALRPRGGPIQGRGGRELERDREGARAADPRQPRQPDRRGRRGAEVRRRRARRGALGRVDRRVRGGRAARRRRRRGAARA